jgi:hypothetical protein
MAQAFVKVIKSPGLNNKNPMLSRLWPKTAVLTAIEQFILFLYCKGSLRQILVQAGWRPKLKSALDRGRTNVNRLIIKMGSHFHYLQLGIDQAHTHLYVVTCYRSK